MKFGVFESHPVADLFPMMGDLELAELAEDIRANGQSEPCIVMRNERMWLLDGRNRWRACEIAGVPPKIRDVFMPDEDRLARYIVGLNLHRRHLTHAQTAMLGVQLLAHFEALAAARKAEAMKGNTRAEVQPDGNQCPPPGRTPPHTAAADAAEVVGVSQREVERAKRVAKSEEAKQVVAHGGSLKEAEAVAAASDPKPKRPKAKPRTHVVEEVNAALKNLVSLCPALVDSGFARKADLIMSAYEAEAG